MPGSLSPQLDSLPRMSKDALSGLWRQLFQSPPPHKEKTNAPEKDTKLRSTLQSPPT